MVHGGAEEEHVSSGEANQQGQQILCARQGSDNDEATYKEQASIIYSHQDTGAQHQGHCYVRQHL